MDADQVISMILLFIFGGLPLIIFFAVAYHDFISFQRSDHEERNHRITFDNFIHMYKMAPDKWECNFNCLFYVKIEEHKFYFDHVRYYFNFSMIDAIRYRHWLKLVEKRKKREEKEAIERERDKELAKLAGYWQEDIDAYTKMCEAETQAAIEKIQKIAESYGCRIEVLKDEV